MAQIVVPALLDESTVAWFAEQLAGGAQRCQDIEMNRFTHFATGTEAPRAPRGWDQQTPRRGIAGTNQPVTGLTQRPLECRHLWQERNPATHHLAGVEGEDLLGVGACERAVGALHGHEPFGELLRQRAFPDAEQRRNEVAGDLWIRDPLCGRHHHSAVRDRMPSNPLNPRFQHANLLLDRDDVQVACQPAGASAA